MPCRRVTCYSERDTGAPTRARRGRVPQALFELIRSQADPESAGAESVGGERRVGERLDLAGLAVAEPPDVDPWQLHFLAGLLALGLAVAQDHHGVALLDELVRREVKRLPVIAERGEQLLDRVLPLGHAVVRELWRLRVLPADVVGEILGGSVEVAP